LARRSASGYNQQCCEWIATAEQSSQVRFVLSNTFKESFVQCIKHTFFILCLPLIVAMWIGIGLVVLVEAVVAVTLLCAWKALVCLNGLWRYMGLEPTGEHIEDIADNRPLPLGFLFFGTAALLLSISHRANLSGYRSWAFWGIWGAFMFISALIMVFVVYQLMWRGTPRYGQLELMFKQKAKKYIMPIACSITWFALIIGMLEGFLADLGPRGDAVLILGTVCLVIALVDSVRQIPKWDTILKPLVVIALTFGILKCTLWHNVGDGVALILWGLLPLVLLALPRIRSMLSSVLRRTRQSQM
jgi:hypothetical protein